MKRMRLAGPLAVLGLMAVGALPARAGVTVAPGQEFLYEGTAAWKVTLPGGRVQTLAGVVSIAALVTGADPAQGYTAIVLRRFQHLPAAGPASFPVDVGLSTLRFSANLGQTSPPETPTGPMSAVLQVLRVPLAPRPALQPGDEWRQTEVLPALPPRPVPLIYHVAGDGKVGERTCTRIEKKLASPLPYQQELGGQSFALTDYEHTIWVDAPTSQVVSHQFREVVRIAAHDQPTVLEITAAISLLSMRPLSSDELAARVKQAAAVDRIRDAISSPHANTGDWQKALAAAGQEAAAFRREFPNSPYAPAVARLDELRNQIQAQVAKAGRLVGLKGAPAPAFSLKSLAGKPLSLAAYRGKVVLLTFFASWSGPSNAAAPDLQKSFWEKYRGRGVVVLGIDSSEPSDPAPNARQFRDQHGLTYPIALDAGSQVSRQYGVTTFPTNLVLDRKGIVRQIVAGYDPAALQQAIAALLHKP